MTLRDQDIRARLYRAQKGCCNAPCEDYAQRRGIFQPERLLESDHIVSDGPDGIENRQLLCSHCNRVKGKRGMAYLLNYLRLKWEREQMPLPLFNSSRIAKRRQPVVVRKQQPQPKRRRLLMLPPPLVSL